MSPDGSKITWCLTTLTLCHDSFVPFCRVLTCFELWELSELQCCHLLTAMSLFVNDLNIYFIANYKITQKCNLLESGYIYLTEEVSHGYIHFTISLLLLTNQMKILLPSINSNR